VTPTDLYTLPVTPDRRFALYKKMATIIVDLTRKNGSCSQEDLLEFGFTKEEAAAHWPMANAMAAIELKLIKSQPATDKRST
jgi:hypothetical protein